MNRQTERPPKRSAIQRKKGDQIGIPVSTETKKLRATLQWMRRDERRCRTISFPTATSSRSRATVTASSNARSRIGTALMVFSSSPRSHLREVGLGIRRALHLLGAEIEVVADGGYERTRDRQQADGSEDVLPEPDSQRHVRVAWQAVPFRMVRVREDRDDARPADTLRVVERGGREAALFELIHAETPQRDHVFLGAEMQAAGGTGFHARRLESHRRTVHAQRALRHLSRLRVELRHVERAARLAIAAADAVVLVHVHDAVRVLHDGARCGAGLEASRLGAVHALVLAHEPHQTALDFAFVEADEIPEAGVERRHRLVGTDLLRRERRQVIPFLARDLAGLAADAGGRVDVLGDRGHASHARGTSPDRSRGAADLEALYAHDRRLPTPSRV